MTTDIPVLEVDADLALKLLEDVVAIVGPDTVVTNCVNVNLDDIDGETWRPCCIVGHALVYGGFLPEELAEAKHEVSDVVDLVGDDYHTISRGKAPVVRWGDKLALDLWKAAQVVQDAQLCWDKALEAARLVYDGTPVSDAIRIAKYGDATIS